MRYYNLIISDTSGQVFKPSPTQGGFTKSAGGSTFTSYLNGQTLPGALNIEFDFPVYPFATPQGQSIIRIWGVGLQMISQSSDLNGQNFQLYAGMQKGLPLANPAQGGLIAQGQIFQAFGNWQGTNQTLDLIVNPGAASSNQDISFAWAANTPLSGAIQTTLAQAFPKYPKPKINIGSSLKLPNTESGHYDNLGQWADYIKQISKKVGMPIYGKDYQGVDIIVSGSTINVYDGTVTPKVINLEFQDLIGQPTWIGPATVSFKCVLRADISVGMRVKFPKGIGAPFALTSAAAAAPNAPASSKTAFQGAFTVNDAHHFANFRQADADSWNTTYTAVTLGTNSSATATQ
jgi:hypothetical protein